MQHYTLYVDAPTGNLQHSINQQHMAIHQLGEAGMRWNRLSVRRAAKQIGVTEHELLCAIGRAAEARKLRLYGLDRIKHVT